MHSFTTSLLAVVALAGRLASAQDPNFDSIDKPLKDEKVPVGQTYTITWSLPSPDTPTGPATITLIGGPAQKSLNPIAAIGHVNNGDLKFEWTVDPSLGADAVYGLNITLDADNSHFQYSNPFQIVGGEAVSTSTSASGSTSATSGSQSTSSATAGASGSATTSGITATTTPLTSSASSSATFTAPIVASAANTTTSAPTSSATHATNATTTAAGNKTTAATKPSATTGDGAQRASAAFGALAVAMVAGIAMNVWGL